MEELKVGDKLYVPKDDKWYNITKIGRIYYQLDHFRRNKVRKDNLKYIDPDYSYSSFEAYRTIEEYKHVQDMHEIRRKVSIFFTYGWQLKEEDLIAVFEVIKKYEK